MEKDSHPVLSKNFGKLISFLYIEGDPFFCIGPDCNFYLGPYFLGLFTFFLLVSLIFLIMICQNISVGNTLTGSLIFGFLLLNYLLAATINPGVETRKEPYNDKEELEDEHFCNICQVYYRNNTQHCDDCGVCIVDYDHHCPWTSKCIGKGNICFFYNFLVGVLLSFIFCIGSLAMLSQVKKN